jgi:tellurite resistance protein TehA-like permease
MRPVASLATRVRHLEPGSFAAVMATGIVSIDVAQHGMPGLAQVMFWLNVVLYATLLAMTAWRAVVWRRALLADFLHPARGAGFLTLAAGTAVLGSQCVMVLDAPRWAAALAAWSALLWFALVYLFLAATITARIKPGFTRSISGGWLVAVVATQALSALLTLIAGTTEGLHFAALTLYMLGAALYLLLITLVVYRMVFFPLRAGEFTPPYWIDMGALAVTTLAGSLIVTSVPVAGPLGQLLPFVKGFTLFFWATATWWIPLLVMLEIWRHFMHRVPFIYETDDWDIVFPIGMYTVGTFELAQALDLDLLRPIPAIGVYVNLAVWLLVALSALRRLFGKA